VVGGGLFPDAVVNVAPQARAGLVVGRVLTVWAKPLNASGATPAVRLLICHQESFHQLSVVVVFAAATELLPSTNAPRLGNANTMTGSLSVEEV
jgi:hypothetical protein